MCMFIVSHTIGEPEYVIHKGHRYIDRNLMYIDIVEIDQNWVQNAEKTRRGHRVSERPYFTQYWVLEKLNC